MFVAMDPGKQGFIAMWSKDTDWITHPMPEEKVPAGGKLKSGKPKMKSEFSPYGLLRLMLTIRKEYGEYEFVTAIEDVHAIFGTSAGSTFNFGKTVGIQTLALHILSENILEVSPKKWQALMWKGQNIIKKPSTSGKTMVNDTKATSIKAAKSLFKGIDLRKNSRCSTDDDNKADALLLCEYLKLTYKK